MGTTPARNEKVLLIDDDEIALMAVSHALESQGFRVLSTAEGAGGLALYKEHRPDLVLLDIGLPGMSGTEVLREIRTYDAMARVIVVTAYSGPAYRTSALRDGARDFVEKPITAGELLARIQGSLHTG